MCLALGITAYKFSKEITEDEESKDKGVKLDDLDKSLRGFSLKVCNSLWGHADVIDKQEVVKEKS